MRLIDADDLMDWSEIVPLTGDGGIDINDFEEKLQSMPTIDAVPVRHGKWIRDEFGARCSGCGLYAYRDKFDKPWESPYCPICGARMDEE